MGYREEYQRWLDKGIMVEELKALSDFEIEECFYKDLKFGTGGIRAIMGPGPNKLNKYTIRKNTEGFARFIEAQGEEAKKKGVVIACDNRNHSQEFCEEAAKVLATHDIHVYLFESLRTTPELSFAVRYLHAAGGINVTASHNPPEYNGYSWMKKLYACKYYKVWKGDLDGREILKQTEPFMIGSVISGSAKLDGETFKKGDHFIIPCGYPEIVLEGNAEFIFSAPSMG